MFEKIRKPGKAKNIFSFIIFGLICLVFVFIGVPVSQMSDIGGVAFVVNNQTVSWSDYRRYVENLERQQKESASFSESDPQGIKIRKQAIQILLTGKLVNQISLKSGFTVPLPLVQSQIRQLPFLQEEGRFKYSKYRNFLKLSRFSAVDFENRVRQDIQHQQFQNIFNWATSSHLSLEEEKDRSLKSFKIQVKYTQISPQKLKEEERQNIKTQIKKGDLSLLNQILEKDQKGEWKTTPVFDLQRTALPGLDKSKILFSKLLKFFPSIGVLPEVVAVRDKWFVLEVLKFQLETEEQKTDLTETDLAFIYEDFFKNKINSQMLYLAWIEQAKASAKIKWNPRLQTFFQSK